MNSDLTRYFNSRSIYLNPTWLSDTLSNLSSSSSSSSSATTHVYNVFLRTPLRLSSIPSLPPNTTDLHDSRIAVSKPIVLEILDIMEVGISLQSIFDTICAYQTGSVKKGNKYKDIREERDKPCDFPRKMLKFVLSDGRQIVDGIEYRPIQEISLNTVLGMKIQLSNVRVLRGVLLLDSSNTKVLGCGYDKIRNIEELKKKVMTCLGMTVDPDSQVQPSSAVTSSPKRQSPVSHFEPTPPSPIPPSSTRHADGTDNSQSAFICIDDEDDLIIRDWADFETYDDCFEPTPPSPIPSYSTQNVDQSENSQHEFIYIDDEDEFTWVG